MAETLFGTVRFQYDVDLEAWVREEQLFDVGIRLGCKSQRSLFDVEIDLWVTSHRFLFDVDLEAWVRMERFFDYRPGFSVREAQRFDAGIGVQGFPPVPLVKRKSVPQSSLPPRRYRGPIESEKENSFFLMGYYDIRRAQEQLSQLELQAKQEFARLILGDSKTKQIGLYSLRLPKGGF